MIFSALPKKHNKNNKNTIFFYRNGIQENHLITQKAVQRNTPRWVTTYY